MSELPDIREEQFARLVAMGETVSRSYEKAGYRADRSNASKMARRVASRIEEIRQEIAEATELTSIDPLTLTGADFAKRGLMLAWKTGDGAKIADAGLKLAKADGSLDEFRPDASHDRTDSQLAAALMPSIKVMLTALKCKIPDDKKLIHAMLLGMGNPGAGGWTDGAGKPIPIDYSPKAPLADAEPITPAA